MSVSPVTSGNAASPTTKSSSSMSVTDFYKIIVTQLQNQSIDSTTDSNAMVQNMMAISNYQAISGMSTDTTKLTNYTGASSLLGKSVTVSPSDGSSTVTGTVSKVSYVSDGRALVTVGGTDYDFGRVNTATPVATTTSTGTTTTN